MIRIPTRSTTPAVNSLLFAVILTLPWLPLSGCNNSGGRTETPGAGRSAGAPVECLLIRTQPLDNIIYTTGTLLAIEEVELRTEISGRITGVHFDEGSRVRAGQLLLKINDRELQAQLKRKEVEERQAADEEERKRRLWDIKAISQEDYDKALNALRMVQADREAIESRLAETEIKAPFDGVIGLRYVSDGGYVTPNVLIASLQNVSTMKAEFSVPERHINQLTNGAEVLVRVAESNEPHRGVVYAVESKIDPGTRTIKARARVPNPRGRLTPGAFGKVEITLQRIPAAVVVPSGAVVPDLAGEFVYVHRDGKARVTPVQTGLRTERATQIITGLAAGDTLIVSGLLQLSDGRPVDIRTLLTE